MLPLTIKSKVTTFAMLLMTADSQLRMKDIESLYDNDDNYSSIPSCQKKVRAWTESHQRELLKIVLRLLDYRFPQLMASGKGVGRGRLAIGSLVMF